MGCCVRSGIRHRPNKCATISAVFLVRLHRKYGIFSVLHENTQTPSRTLSKYLKSLCPLSSKHPDKLTGITTTHFCNKHKALTALPEPLKPAMHIAIRSTNSKISATAISLTTRHKETAISLTTALLTSSCRSQFCPARCVCTQHTPPWSHTASALLHSLRAPRLYTLYLAQGRSPPIDVRALSQALQTVIFRLPSFHAQTLSCCC